MRKIIGQLRSAWQDAPIRYVWLALPLAISFIAMNFTPLKEGDLWWHLKVGEIVLERRQVPQLDEFTFTAFHQPYLFNHSWFSDVVLYFSEQAGGLPLLVLWQSLIATTIAGLILHESLVRGAPPALAAVLTLASWVGIFPYSSIRPQAFSFLSFTLFFVLCSDHTQRKVNRLWLLPGVMLLWVNLHGAWIMGPILWAVYLCGSVLQRWWNPSRAVSAYPLLAWGLASILVLPINPSGLAVYRSLLSAGSNAINQQFVSEWQPLTITNPLSWAFFGLLALWILGLANTTKRPALHEVVLLLVFAAFGLRYLRMPPFFFIVAAPVVAETLAGIPLDDLKARLGRLPDVRSEKRQINILINRAFLSVMLGAAVFSIPPIRVALANQDSSSLISPQFPVAAVHALKQNVRPGTRLYNLAEWGGYLIWQTHPDALVFADGRVELLNAADWEDYITLSTGAAGWRELVEQYQISYLVLSKSRQAGLILNAYQQGWHCLCEDDVAIVLSRQGSGGNCPSLENRDKP
ncbi:MAG: hypothetical protein ACOYYS_07360 [Chloroflexota bacterium]